MHTTCTTMYIKVTLDILRISLWLATVTTDPAFMCVTGFASSYDCPQKYITKFSLSQSRKIQVKSLSFNHARMKCFRNLVHSWDFLNFSALFFSYCLWSALAHLPTRSGSSNSSCCLTCMNTWGWPHEWRTVAKKCCASFPLKWWEHEGEGDIE